MRMHVVTVALSLAAGLHAASCGAWKDAPHESFKRGSFARELVIAGLVGLGLCWVDHLASPFLIFLSAFTLCRIVTEFYKLFVRNQRQDVYRIPTQVHWVGHVVSAPSMRLLLGVGWLGAIYGLYRLLDHLPRAWSASHVGPAVGLVFGLALAIGGGYKDGSVTGFAAHKFVRSPITGAIGGLIVSLHPGGLKFVVLGSIACERMLTELLFKILRPGYVGGHFKSLEPLFPDWVEKRKMFVIPYVLTWILFVGLWVAGT